MNWSQLLRDMGPSLSFGGVAGLVVGFTAKRIAKVAAIALGCLFILIQGLAYMGLISIHWGLVEARATGVWIDVHGTTVGERLWEVITLNLPFGGAFVAGFYIGFHKG